MATVDSQIYEVVLSQITALQRPVAFTLKCVFDIEGFLFSPYKVLNEDGVKDFHGKFSDEIVLEVAMSQGDYTRYIYPSLEKLQIQLIRSDIGELEDGELRGRQPTVRRYKAILQDNANLNLQGMPSVGEDNAIISVSFQLVDLATDELRLQTTGGIFHNTSAADVLKTLLGYYSKQLKLSDDVAVKGVHVYTPSNDEVRENVVIPHGTDVLDLAGYLQKHCGGIYNQGIGMYLHKNIWFVYPLMDKYRYELEKLALDLFVIPSNRMSQIERTYQLKDQRLQILITGDVRQNNTSDLDFLRFGNGTMFSKATKTFNQFAEVSGNVAKTEVTSNVSRFIIEKRNTSFQYTPFSSNRITDNVAYEMSKLISRTGQMVSLVWENARQDLIYPGMPVKVFYGTDAGAKSHYGQVAHVQYHTTLNQPGMSSTRYKTTCVLSLFLDTK